MASIRDLAALSQDIYDMSAGSTTASGRGWRRRDPMNWREGFAAGTYEKAGEVVIAFRGTEDQQDLVDDLLMVPVARPGAAQRTLEGMLRLYGVREARLLEFLAPRLVEGLLQNATVQGFVTRELNRVPTEQVRQALQYVDTCRPAAVAVCGHSLGGALAQVVSQQRGLPCVSFNGPFMGDIRGAVAMSSAGLVYVNAVGDPLSYSTAAMGHVPHGRVFDVRLPPFRAAPTVTPAAVPTWLRFLSPTLGAGVAMAETATFYRDTLVYLADAMLYHHSIDTLVPVVDTDRRFSAPLSATTTF